MNFKNNTQNNQKEKTAVLEYIRYDAKDHSYTVYNTLTIKEKDVVDLSTKNNITIVEINDENIKISREITRYRIISEEEKRAESYQDTIEQTIKYGDYIPLHADESNPFQVVDPLEPVADEAPRYSEYVKVVKETNSKA